MATPKKKSTIDKTIPNTAPRDNTSVNNLLPPNFAPHGIVPTLTQVNDPYPVTSKMIKALIKNYPQYKNYTESDFNKLLDNIKMVESRGKNIAQKGGGPGRGYYQMEKGASSITARKRYNNIANELMSKGDTLPKLSWDDDFTKIDEDSQRAHALANMIGNAAAARKSGKKGAFIDPKNPKNTWLDYHWAGSSEDRPIREKHWDATIKRGKGGKTNTSNIKMLERRPSTSGGLSLDSIDQSYPALGANVLKNFGGKYNPYTQVRGGFNSDYNIMGTLEGGLSPHIDINRRFEFNPSISGSVTGGLHKREDIYTVDPKTGTINYEVVNPKGGGHATGKARAKLTYTDMPEISNILPFIEAEFSKDSYGSRLPIKAGVDLRRVFPDSNAYIKYDPLNQYIGLGTQINFGNNRPMFKHKGKPYTPRPSDNSRRPVNKMDFGGSIQYNYLQDSLADKRAGDIAGAINKATRRDYKTGVWNTLGDVGKFYADNTLGALGMTNVIDSKDYSTRFGAKTLNKASAGLSGVTQAIAPIALNAVAPGAGTLYSAGLMATSGLNPRDSDQSVNDWSMVGGIAGQTIGAAQMLGAFKHGGNIGGEYYNMKRAKQIGYTPDQSGHWPSVDYTDGSWLKSAQHPTAWKEKLYGYDLNPAVSSQYNLGFDYGGYFGKNQLKYYPKNLQEFKHGGSIHIKPSKRGTFTAAAKKHGKSVQAFASQVLKNKDNYSPAMVKKANFARNASKWKHAEGGLLGDDPTSMINIEGKGLQEGFMPLMKKGGELLVNEGKINKNYIAYNPHPKYGMDPSSTVFEKGGVVIPKKYSTDYLNGNMSERKRIEAQVIQAQKLRNGSNIDLLGSIPMAGDGWASNYLKRIPNTGISGMNSNNTGIFGSASGSGGNYSPTGLEKFGDIATKALSLSYPIEQAITGKLGKTEIENPENFMVKTKIAAPNFSAQEPLREIDASGNAGLNSLRRMGMYNPASVAGLVARTGAEKAKVYENLYNMNMEGGLKAAMANLQTDQLNAQTKFATADLNAKNRAAKENLYWQGRKGMSDYGNEQTYENAFFDILPMIADNPQFNAWAASVGQGRRKTKTKTKLG